jgi:hypothetical protein
LHTGRYSYQPRPVARRHCRRRLTALPRMRSAMMRSCS